MGLMETVLSAVGDQDLGDLAKKIGISGDDVKSAVASLVPEFASGIVGKAEENPRWITDFFKEVQAGRHQKYVDEPKSLTEEETVTDGNKILGHVLGSKDASRAAAQKAAEKTGLDYGALKKALPLVAALAMGSMSKTGLLGKLAGSLDGDDVTALLKKLI